MEGNIYGNKSNGKAEYIRAVKSRYLLGDREEKNNILNELCLNTGYYRRHAIRVLKEPEIEEIKRRVCRESRGRKSKYRDPEFKHEDNSLRQPRRQ